MSLKTKMLIAFCILMAALGLIFVIIFVLKAV